MLEAAAELYCRPVVPFEAQKWTILGKTILEVDIARADKRPFMAQGENERWLAYLRVEDQNLLANRVMMKVWRKEKRKKGIFLEYSNAEKGLLNYLKSNDYITLSKFCRICRIRLKQAEEILSDLIVLEIIQIRMSEKGARYSLISQV
jgi:predicted HTH transcriptional regulator